MHSTDSTYSPVNKIEQPIYRFDSDTPTMWVYQNGLLLIIVFYTTNTRVSVTFINIFLHRQF